MKELSIEEKARLYDEAIEVAQRFYNNSVAITKKGLEDIFPELKESEDERIRQFLIQEVTETSDKIMSYRNMNKEDVLAWLEKQAEQDTDISSFPKEQQMFMQKYVSLDKVTLIKLLAERDTNTAEIIESFEKQGENTYNKELSELLHKVICRFINDPEILYSDREKVSMKVLPYVERLEKQGEQKPAEWSDKDEKLYQSALWHIKNSCGNQGKTSGEYEVYHFVKSLKDRVQPQNTWKPSEEQMDALHDAAVYVDKSMFPYPKGILMKLYEQLKKLREE